MYKRQLPIFDGVELWPDLDEEALLAVNPNIILICDEVGCGVVPIDPAQRTWREQVLSLIHISISSGWAWATPKP